MMVKLDIGSGPKDYWYSEDPEWLHLDCEPYEGVIPWTCPSQLPIENNSVDEVYMGQFLIELDINQQLALADELARVMKSDGRILIHDYNGSSGFPEFFERMEKHGWYRIQEELQNVFEEPDGELIVTYLVELQKLRR